MKVDRLTDSYAVYFWTGNEVMDFFAYYKMQWFLIFTVAAITMAIYYYYKGYIKVKKTLFYIPAAVYSAAVILSTFTSQNTTISLFGFTGRYEGMFVLLGYIVVMLLSVNLVNNENQAVLIIKWLAVSAFIIGIIGLLERFDIYVLTWEGVRDLLLPAEKNGMDISFLKDIRAFYSTISHYDYAGSYFAMLFPISVVILAFVKGRKEKAAAAMFSCIMLANWIVCNSRAGVVGGFVALVIIVIMFRSMIKKHWKISLAVLSLFIIAFVVANVMSSGRIFGRVGSIITDAVKIFSAQKYEGIKDITSDSNEIRVIFEDKELKIIYDDKTIKLKDENDMDIPAQFDGNSIKITDERYNGTTFTVSNNKDDFFIEMNYASLKLRFAVTKSGLRLVNHRDQTVNLEPVEKWGFEGLERIGSARGYIWSRSIPLLKNTVIAGYGPDTYAIHFPQEDYVGKLIAYDTISMFVDKAHNMYLATAINTGIISLLALLAMFIIYFVSSWRIYYKSSFNDKYSYIGLAIFAAFVGYTISGLFNDSVLSVAPVFWVLLGVGISINDKLKNKTELNNK
ncbi:O-antigen ligase family protein [Oxobacter pfennigii]|nr:O-antigen ligase family protein [Oxobacter pfennigii]